jgi:REP element-mobilizing transposase RayT
MKYNPKIHHRRSIRLKGYDYTQPGAYFVTLTTVRRASVFGDVVNGEMKLSALGEIVLDEWMRSIGIRKEIQLHEDEFVVMPNHIHGIVWMVDVNGVHPGNASSAEGGACHAPRQASGLEIRGANVGADGIRPGVHPGNTSPAKAEEGACHAPRQAGGSSFQRISKSLGSFIAGFKAAVTSRARRELNVMDIWQTNYYEHIIRNEAEFENIWKYIDNNPRQWEQDQLNPTAPANRFNQE